MESSRISFDNLLQVVLGSICDSWGFDGSDPAAVAQLLRSISLNCHSSRKDCPTWIHMLGDASNSFLSSKGDLRSLNRKLIALGRTRGSKILAETGFPPPVFGLTNMESMMKLLKTPESRLRLLRTYAARYFPKADPVDVILRYRVPVASRGLPRPETPEQVDSVSEGGRVKSQKDTMYTASRRRQKRVRDVNNSDSILGPFPAGVGSRRSPSKERKSLSGSRGSILAQQIEGTTSRPSVLKGMFTTSALEVSGRFRQMIEDERTALPQIIDPSDQDVLLERSAVAAEGSNDDIVEGKRTDAPRIETHLVDDDENAHFDAIPASEPTAVEYATALPCKPSPPSSDTASTLYRWMDPRQKVESLGEEEFAERLVCREKPQVCNAIDQENRQWLVHHDTFRETAVETDSINTRRCYMFCSGDPKTAAMFVDGAELVRCQKESGGPNWGRTRLPIKKTCELKDLQAALDANAVDTTEMLAVINHVAKDSTYFDSLKALIAAYKIYNELDGATVSPNVITKPIISAKWAQRVKSNTDHFPRRYPSSYSLLNRLQTFACIAYFESDGLDMNPSQFENVMALSSGDSIYVAAWLICDPAERRPAHAVCRLHGNVGKAGLILLVPPADPKTLEPGIDNWKFIDREEFDGTVTNSFTGTSLHLSFTDWCIPIDVGEAGRGRRDAEAYIIESLVSVYDRGKWIADLDVLQALSKGCDQPDHKFFYKPFCDHGSADVLDPTRTFPPLVTIKNWDEFLEHPKSPAVAMVRDNWDAKLALAVLGVRRGDRVFVMDRICDTCYTDVSIIGGPERIAKALFLL